MESAAPASSRGVTQVADPEVMRAWRTGPRWYHVVVATIDDPMVEQRRGEIADLMADLVTLTTPGQPHVTLWAAGFDTVPELPGTTALTVSIGGPATFSSALYLTVEAADLPELRADFMARNLPEHRDGSYTPHVTVGLYRRRFPIAGVEQRLAALGAYPPLSVIARIEHCVIDTRTDRLRPAPA